MKKNSLIKCNIINEYTSTLVEFKLAQRVHIHIAILTNDYVHCILILSNIYVS